MDIGTLKDILIGVGVPVGLLLIGRILKKSDERSAEWRGNMTKKIDSICVDNKHEHEELYNYKNDHSDRLTEIETVHKVKGCAIPR
jgi:hypothetical protein